MPAQRRNIDLIARVPAGRPSRYPLAAAIAEWSESQALITAGLMLDLLRATSLEMRQRRAAGDSSAAHMAPLYILLQEMALQLIASDERQHSEVGEKRLSSRTTPAKLRAVKKRNSG